MTQTGNGTAWSTGLEISSTRGTIGWVAGYSSSLLVQSFRQPFHWYVLPTISPLPSVTTSVINILMR